MEKPEPPQQPSAPQPQSAQPQSPAQNMTAPALKPNKNVSVPKYDLLTEGYDPAKLKGR